MLSTMLQVQHTVKKLLSVSIHELSKCVLYNHVKSRGNVILLTDHSQLINRLNTVQSSSFGTIVNKNESAHFDTNK